MSETSQAALMKILGQIRKLNRRDRRFLLHALADREYLDDKVEELEERKAALKKKNEEARKM